MSQPEKIISMSAQLLAQVPHIGNNGGRMVAEPWNRHCIIVANGAGQYVPHILRLLMHDITIWRSLSREPSPFTELFQSDPLEQRQKERSKNSPQVYTSVWLLWSERCWWSVAIGLDIAISSSSRDETPCTSLFQPLISSRIRRHCVSSLISTSSLNTTVSSHPILDKMCWNS